MSDAKVCADDAVPKELAHSSSGLTLAVREREPVIALVGEWKPLEQIVAGL
jgi:hypothetical protein